MSPVRRSLELVFFALAPLAFVVALLASEDHTGKGVAWDFHETFLPAARAVAHGASPYGHVTAGAIRAQTAFVYPPLVAYLTVPFTWMPAIVAEYLVSGLVVASVPVILWLLGVRDWRCVGVGLVWSPVVFTIRLGALSVALALAVALVWRFRDRAGVTAIATGLAVATKLFLWPVAVWLLATRRYRALALSVVAAVALLLLPWAALSFAGLGSYPHLLHVLSSIEAPESYTLAALLGEVGVGWHLAEALGAAAGLAVLGIAVYVGRRGDERASFVLVVAAALALSPIVWVHYFALLLVPLSLLAPSLSPAWLVPIFLFAVPVTPGVASAGDTALGLALAAATLAAAVIPRLGPRAAARGLWTPNARDAA